MAELVGRLGIEKKHPLNVNSLSFIKGKKYETTIPVLTHIPIGFQDFSVTCPDGHEFVPDWIGKAPPPAAIYHQGGTIRQSSYSVPCKTCGKSTSVSLPNPGRTGEVNLYGDEAFRELNGKTYAVYSFIAFNGPRNRERKFVRKFKKLKGKTFPEKQPEEWVVHLTELYRSAESIKNQSKREREKRKINKFITSIISLIREHNDNNQLTIFSGISHASGTSLGGDKLRALKSNTYNSIIIRILHEATSNGVSPYINFERTNKDGWAKSIFEGGSLCLLWGFITNTISVAEPKFLPPSESSFFEIADIVSFLLARNIYYSASIKSGQPSSLDHSSDLLGTIRYVVTMSNGDWQYYTLRKLPFDKIENGKKIEHDTKKYPFSYFVKVK